MNAGGSAAGNRALGGQAIQTAGASECKQHPLEEEMVVHEKAS